MEIPWALFRRGAVWLFAAALIAGFGVTALYQGHHIARGTWLVIFVLALVVLTITSAALLPGVLLPNVQNPHPEFLSEDLRDEWGEMRSGSISRPHLLMAAGIVAALAYIWCLLYFGKLTEAFWFGWLPVGAAAVLLSLLMFAFARRTGWYNDRFYRTPNWIILVAFGGFALSQFLGVFMTEQVVVSSADPVAAAAEVDYGYIGSRAYYMTRNYLNVGPVPDISVPDCDGDACGYLFLAVLVVVLTLILVAGAALVPHMWVLSCLVLLTLIALLILHEVRRDRNLIVVNRENTDSARRTDRKVGRRSRTDRGARPPGKGRD